MGNYLKTNLPHSGAPTPTTRRVADNPELEAESPVSERQIEVESISPEYLAPDLSTIPQAIREFLELGGKVLSLFSSHPTQIAARSLNQSYPVSVDHDIDPSKKNEFIHACRQNGFVVDPTGVIRRGDCLVFSQDSRAREAELDVAQRLYDSMSYENQIDPQSIADKIPGQYRGIAKKLHVQSPNDSWQVPISR